MIITLGDALKELMQQLKGITMTQLRMFEQKPILEVLKPIRFVDGKWQISQENKNIYKSA